MKPATFAPAYVSIYPGLAQICRLHGYALSVHGSVQRDFDLIAIPWVEDAGSPEEVVAEIIKTFAITVSGHPDTTHHGRIRYGLCLCGEGFVDLGFMPRLPRADLMEALLLRAIALPGQAFGEARTEKGTWSTTRAWAECRDIEIAYKAICAQQAKGE